MNISWTFINTYRTCPLRAKLQYIDKVIPRDKVDHRPFIVGIVGDWLFRKWVEKDFQEGWMRKKSKDIFDWWLTKVNIKFRSGDDYWKLLYKLQKSVESLESASFRLSLNERDFKTQKKLTFEEGGFKFTGKLDLWFPEEKAIWDLKITESVKYLKKGQLFFYKWMMEKAGYEISELAFLVPLRTKDLEEIEYAQEDLQEFETGLVSTLEDVRDRKFDRNTGGCWGCPVVKWCQREAESMFDSHRGEDGIFIVDVKKEE